MLVASIRRSALDGERIKCLHLALFHNRTFGFLEGFPSEENRSEGNENDELDE